MSACFHCGETIPKGVSLFVTINNQEQPMCCYGCQAVAETIVENKLTDFYKYRTQPSTKVELSIPEELKKNQVLDDSELQNEFTFSDGENKEAIISLDGLNCAACAWLIEKQLSPEQGVLSINVNATTHRASIKWQDNATKLSHIINRINQLGYQAQPFQSSNVEESNQKASKAFIKRLGVSGVLMMQILMIATGLYFGAFSGIAEHNLIYLRWVSLILSIPIVSYCAYPFYRSTINSLKIKRLSMDLPVSIAILLAFTASAWATIFNEGEVYFESISMFTFLLLVGKFLEFRARSRAAEVSANLLKLMPMTATRIKDGITKLVAAKKLNAGEKVIVKPGETVPADGFISDGQSQLNEAMITGEQRPIDKTVGAEVFAGTINGDGLITVEVKHNNQQSFLSQLIQLSENAQHHKPKIAQLSDKIAQYFVAILLIVASSTALYWHQQLPEEALWITLAVLVATCPCALSLATPTALTCATTNLNRSGIMIKSAHVLETIQQVDNFSFDKTGTLTSGQFSLIKLENFDAQYCNENILAIAATLESYSQHPIAKAFAQYKNDSITCSKAEVSAGNGVSGEISGVTYHIGKPAWLLSESELDQFHDYQCLLVAESLLSPNESDVTLEQNHCVIAGFKLADEIRHDAFEVINSLHQQKINTTMLSGDSAQGCQSVQEVLNLNAVFAGLSAQEKLEQLSELQQNYTTAMVGDGVNDAPVFAAAHVSIAMGCGTDIAKSGADVILLNDKLSSISLLRALAHKTKRIIWQNYGWAIGYNAVILPLAVSGHVTPYLAVIGMSLSSLIVVTNSLRLLKKVH